MGVVSTGENSRIARLVSQVVLFRVSPATSFDTRNLSPALATMAPASLFTRFVVLKLLESVVTVPLFTKPALKCSVEAVNCIVPALVTVSWKVTLAFLAFRLPPTRLLTVPKTSEAPAVKFTMPVLLRPAVLIVPLPSMRAVAALSCRSRCCRKSRPPGE